MATTTAELEERIVVLETEVARLKETINTPRRPHERWWHEIAGTYANCPEFEEAVRLGREYRESQRENEETEG